MGHVIGFKTSKHTGQQFLTFRPAKVYIGEYADYGDFLTFSETALTTYIDPVVEAEPLRMGDFAAELDKMLNDAVTSIGGFGNGNLGAVIAIQGLG
jgi:hypothetical protein